MNYPKPHIFAPDPIKEHAIYISVPQYKFVLDREVRSGSFEKFMHVDTFSGMDGFDTLDDSGFNDGTIEEAEVVEQYTNELNGVDFFITNSGDQPQRVRLFGAFIAANFGNHANISISCEPGRNFESYAGCLRLKSTMNESIKSFKIEILSKASEAVNDIALIQNLMFQQVQYDGNGGIFHRRLPCYIHPAQLETEFIRQDLTQGITINNSTEFEFTLPAFTSIKITFYRRTISEGRDRIQRLKSLREAKKQARQDSRNAKLDARREMKLSRAQRKAAEALLNFDLQQGETGMGERADLNLNLPTTNQNNNTTTDYFDDL